MRLEAPALLDLPPYFDLACAGDLIWLEACGIGICRKRPPADLYAHSYLEEFRRRDSTEMGERLTAARMAFVLKHDAGADLVDIGVGGGLFVRQMGCYGYDVNPEAIAWLKHEDRWHDVRIGEARAFSMWDVLEHSLDWSVVLRNCKEWAFISTPIYRGKEHCLASRHFKPPEHQLFFTERGLIHFMHWHNFRLVSSSQMESAIGRDGIGTYAFRRTS